MGQNIKTKQNYLKHYSSLDNMTTNYCYCDTLNKIFASWSQNGVLTPVMQEATILTPVMQEATILTPVMQQATILTPVMQQATILTPVMQQATILWARLSLLFLRVPSSAQKPE